MNIDVITVNTPSAEIQMSFNAGQSLGECIEQAERAYPEWTSMVVVILPIRD